MATSNVQIANLALQKLGQSRKLESLTQDHPNARSMNLAFEPTRDALLRRYAWSFAIHRESIAADANGPAWGNWNRYSLPGDFLRLLRDDESGIETDWKIEGLYILSADSSPLQFRYIRKITDPTYYDAMFVEAFACALALRTCKEITGSNALIAELKDDFDTAIEEAKNAGALEKRTEDEADDDWVTAKDRS
jgi:hypothetical protein